MGLLGRLSAAKIVVSQIHSSVRLGDTGSASPAGVYVTGNAKTVRIVGGFAFDAILSAILRSVTWRGPTPIAVRVALRIIGALAGRHGAENCNDSNDGRTGRPCEPAIDRRSS